VRLIDHRIGKKPQPSAKAFFEDVCTTLFRMRADDCRAMGGTYCFELKGRGGGSWTLDFANTTLIRRECEATLVLRTTTEAFEALLAGELDVPVAVADGTLTFEGDPKLFSNLAKFTAPQSRPS
jgi:hypothetical protein